MDIQQKNFMNSTARQADLAGHVFPAMAAAEAALESRYGTSQLAIKDNNLFGLKLHTHNVYGVHVLPTKEFLNGQWVAVSASWESYPRVMDCFADRMLTLQRLSSVYPNYDAALKATDPVSYVTAVSKTWSTDPQRAAKVIAIYTEYANEFGIN